MRYLILSDMHSNWEAFRATLNQVRRKRFDAYLVLGDLVGYGGAPNQVVEAVRALGSPLYTVRGNHDKVVAGIDSGDGFNPAALEAAQWTAETLQPGHLRYVRDLPQGPRQITEDLAICHGSPLDEDAYVFTDLDAYAIFATHTTPVTFFGHTHVPSLFVLSGGRVELSRLKGEGGTIELEPGSRYLINPGSIGQPRDRDPRAAYMIYDSEKATVRWYRIDYPVERAQRRIRRAGLPGVLADRLAVGM